MAWLFPALSPESLYFLHPCSHSERRITLYRAPLAILWSKVLLDTYIPITNEDAGFVTFRNSRIANEHLQVMHNSYNLVSPLWQLLLVNVKPKVQIRFRGSDAPTVSTLNKTLLNQKRLDNIFKGIFVFA